MKTEKLDQDPTDRFIGATAIYYNLILATGDRNLISYPEINTISCHSEI